MTCSSPAMNLDPRTRRLSELACRGGRQGRGRGVNMQLHHTDRKYQGRIGLPQQLLHPILLHPPLDLSQPPSLPLDGLSSTAAGDSTTGTTSTGGSSTARGVLCSGEGSAAKALDRDKLRDFLSICNKLREDKVVFLSFDLKHGGKECEILQISGEFLKILLIGDQPRVNRSKFYLAQPELL